MRSLPPMGVAARWAGLLAATTVAAVGLDAVGLPSPALFAALMVGLVAAVWMPASPDVPIGVFRAAQALTGASLGVYVQSSSLHAVAHAWLPVALVSAATLALSIGCGLALSAVVGIDRATGALGMVAGGASGIVGMAFELGADDRLVAVMQYLRVLIVVVLTPIVVGVAFSHGHAHNGTAASGGPVFGDARDWLWTAVALAIGTAAAVATRIPAGSLLGPMVAAALITLALGHGGFREPAVLREPAFAAIGLQVGLRFTPELVRRAGKLLLPSLACVAALLVACFGLALMLRPLAHISLLDAYLATTPGGLYAVLAAAFGTGADTTFVIAVQTLRLFVMILLAPLVVRRLATSPVSGAA